MPPPAPSAGCYSVPLGRLPVVSRPNSASLPCRPLRSVEDLRSVRLRSASAFPHLICHRRCRSAISIPKFDQFGDKPKGDSSFFMENDDDDDKQAIDVSQKIEERCFAGTSYIPVYVMLPLDVIDNQGKLAYPEILLEQLRALKSINVDGVMVDCWWGIVEASAPRIYNWGGYKQLFQIVQQLKLKLQVVMSFHECGDREGRRNMECLSWGIDRVRILQGRTAVEVYFDYMRSFRVEFDEFFEDGTISELQIGLGPCGELRYPSYPAKHGWRYPGIGEFQCYDAYLMKSLRDAAKARGHPLLGKVPPNSGSYNSQPHETGFFRDGGHYDNSYGRFFLGWYSKVLIDHGDLVLSLAKLAFEGSLISAKVSGIHWWYKTASHAAELTAGFYNPCNRDGYASIVSMFKKHDATLNFTCVELRTMNQQADFPEALADPEGLVWQVLNAAWDASLPMASENALPCYDRDGYNKILDNAKPSSDPDGRHLSSFTYLRLNPVLMCSHNFKEFSRFVQRMHGEWVPNSC
ncbi:beta-amylase 2, chloroplastic-like isoform X2 [Curcuma longa]|uniref:beta-amylase 2, chloroplastic-like isoform X2 n=1 Tax=Curcuma longa TaxID=136217 RepID=UPI003D9DBCC4